MRRVAFELAGLILAAALAGTALSRIVLARPAFEAMRVAGTFIPPIAPVNPLDDDRRAISLSSLLATSSPTPNAQPTPSAHANPRRTAITTASIADQPSVHREGDHLHIDLHGGGANADLLAGAEVILRDMAFGGGYFVRSVDQAGLLAAAGVSPGDVIVSVNGEPTLSPDQALMAFALAQHATTITLGLKRGDRTFEVIADVVR